jgi:Bacterial pre-peptidase C-terminal domain
LGAGKTRTLKIRILSHGGLNSFASGSLSLVSKKHAVRIPVVARPVALSVTSSVEGSNTSGNVHITGKAGSSGTLSATVQGLVGSTPATGTVQGDGGSLANADVTSFTVPAGTRVSRIDLDAGTGSNDLDLYLFANDGTPFDPSTDPLVALSASGSASERLLGRIPAGDYWVVVDGFDVDSGGGDYTLTTWNVSNSDNGNLSLAPASQPVSKGNTFSITGSYAGLNASRVYFGQVISTLGSRSGTTFVTIRP